MANPANHAANKKDVYRNLHTLCAANDADFNDAVATLYGDGARLFAFLPVDEQVGREAIADALWRPIRNAFPDLERRDQIVIAGAYDDDDYVCAVGHLQGTFVRDLHDIPASQGVATLRYGEIHQVAEGKVIESHVLIDLLDLMHQVGCWPIAPSPRCRTRVALARNP